MRFNVAARAGRWSAGHWKTALSGWIAFCVVAVALGSVAGTKMLKDADTAAGETKTAEHHAARRRLPRPRGESVLVESKTATLSDPRFRAAVEDVDRTVSALPNVTERPLAARTGERRPVSSDRRSALVQFEIAGDEDNADEKVQPDPGCGRARAGPHAASPSPSSASRARNHELDETLGKDFQRAEYSSLPVTLIILLVAFGALVAAGLPVLLALHRRARDDRSVCVGQPCGRRQAMRPSR